MSAYLHGYNSEHMLFHQPIATPLPMILMTAIASLTLMPKSGTSTLRSRRGSMRSPAKDNGVMFHFRRGLSVKNDVVDGRLERLALTNGRSDVRVENALVKAQSLKRVTDLEYTALASQLAETESLVDSIASCMKKPSFLELAARVLKEMQLLLKTTQQIRANGTTLILANMGKRQNADFTQAFQRLVARAALVQMRIGALMDAIMQLMV
ncbi:unnamed protein product [Peronospora destructor]|uniref:Uncharacterized protein n=1 Tax=Peronospora destructor TaxID=86335 RepID=A0AAV0SY49_9STRA|nr:unnamed protein product [Peronospora destructor]